MPAGGGDPAACQQEACGCPVKPQADGVTRHAVTRAGSRAQRVCRGPGEPALPGGGFSGARRGGFSGSGLGSHSCCCPCLQTTCDFVGPCFISQGGPGATRRHPQASGLFMPVRVVCGGFRPTGLQGPLGEPPPLSVALQRDSRGLRASAQGRPLPRPRTEITKARLTK